MPHRCWQIARCKKGVFNHLSLIFNGNSIWFPHHQYPRSQDWADQFDLQFKANQAISHSSTNLWSSLPQGLQDYAKDCGLAFKFPSSDHLRIICIAQNPQPESNDAIWPEELEDAAGCWQWLWVIQWSSIFPNTPHIHIWHISQFSRCYIITILCHSALPDWGYVRFLYPRRWCSELTRLSKVMEKIQSIPTVLEDFAVLCDQKMYDFSKLCI